jgi:EpsI family protein
MAHSRRQTLAIAAAMAGTAAGAALLAPSRQVADERARQPLDRLFPLSVGSWVADGRARGLIRPTQDHARLYGVYDQILERIYQHSDRRTIMLSVAYGSEQSVGLQVHRPEICYPGSGFEVSGLHRAVVSVDGKPLPMTRLLAARPGRREPITYWSLLGDVAQEDETAFRWRQLSFGLRGQVVDGMLVRLSSIDADTARAFACHAEFADALARATSPTQRVRIFGKPSDA